MDEQETSKYQSTTSGDDNDEFYGNQDDDDDADHHHGEFGSLGHHEILAKNRELQTIGYMQSFDETKEIRLQQGFEGGYRDTYTVSKALGEAFGKLVTEAEFLGNQQEDGTTTSPELSFRLHEFLTQFQNRPADCEFNGKESIELLHQELFSSKTNK